MRDEVGVAQPERLAYTHPGLDQQHQQEPVPEVLAGLDQGQGLFFVEGAGQVPGLAQPQRSGGTGPPPTWCKKAL